MLIVYLVVSIDFNSNYKIILIPSEVTNLMLFIGHYPIGAQYLFST